jgi:two-component system, sporulation sensor kinase A
MVENNIHISEKDLFSSAFNEAPIGMALVGVKGDFLKINKSFCEMLGYSESELRGLTFPEITHSEDVTKNIDNYYKLLNREINTYKIVKRYIHKFGQTVWGLLSVTMVQDKKNGLSFFIVQVKDITLRKKAEQALKESYEQYRLLADQLPDPMVVHKDEKILYVNQATIALMGLTDDIKGRGIYEFIHPYDIKKIKDTISYILETGQKMYNIDFRLLHQDGHFVEVEASASFITYTNQTCIQAVMRDSTIHKNAEKKSAELFQYPDRLNTLGELAAGIAHEIRNPLTSIKGFVQLFQNELEDQPYSQYFDLILSEINRINFIVSELLYLSKQKNGSFTPEDIGRTVTQVVSLLTPQANYCAIEIMVEIESDLPKVNCDVGKLKQVFINLLKNAIESMPKGGLLNVMVKRKDYFLHIKVVDQGCGIPQNLISKIGKPFFTTKKEGTGLGIMISKDIIEHHQGRFNIHSFEKIGTTIEIELPISGPYPT